jgi:hypothetical protein
VTRQSFQKGYVSNPIRTRQGIIFKIRYRLRTAQGWRQKSETLHGLTGKKAARAVLDQRIRDINLASSKQKTSPCGDSFLLIGGRI